MAGSGPSHATAAPGLKTLSYNIKNTKGDTATTWSQRFAGIKGVITDANPDIIGLTETDATNLASVDAAFVGTGATQFTRYPAVDSANVLLWQNNRFALVNAGKTFFSNSCAGQNRNMVWATLRDLKTTNVYFVVMTHLTTDDGVDCLSARQEEVGEILAAVDARPAGSRPIVMGDLNNQTPKCGGTTAGAPIDTLGNPTANHNLNPTVPKAADCTAANATFNAGWDSSTANDTKRIDYIFADSSLTATKTGIDKRMVTIDGKTKSPSDHYPIWAVLTP